MVERAAVNREVEGSSPSSGANSCRLGGNDLGGFTGSGDTKTDTKITPPAEFAFTRQLLANPADSGLSTLAVA